MKNKSFFAKFFLVAFIASFISFFVPIEAQALPDRTVEVHYDNQFLYPDVTQADFETQLGFSKPGDLVVKYIYNKPSTTSLVEGIMSENPDYVPYVFSNISATSTLTDTEFGLVFSFGFTAPLELNGKKREDLLFYALNPDNQAPADPTDIDSYASKFAFIDAPDTSTKQDSATYGNYGKAWLYNGLVGGSLTAMPADSPFVAGQSYTIFFPVRNLIAAFIIAPSSFSLDQSQVGADDKTISLNIALLLPASKIAGLAPAHQQDNSKIGFAKFDDMSTARKEFSDEQKAVAVQEGLAVYASQVMDFEFSLADAYGDTLTSASPVVLQMNYSSRVPVSGATFGNDASDNFFVEYLNNAQVPKRYVMVANKSNIAGQYWIESASDLGNPVALNTLIAAGTNYNVYYVVDTSAPGENSTNLEEASPETLSNASRLLVPASTVADQAKAFVALASEQADPNLQTAEDYLALYNGTLAGQSSKITFLDYGFMGSRTPVGGPVPSLSDSRNTIAATTTLPANYFTNAANAPKAVTYAVQFTVPDYITGEEKDDDAFIKLNPTINDVKVTSYATGSQPFIYPMVYEKPNAPSEALSWVKGPNDAIVEQNSSLSAGDHIVYYTVPINATARQAMSNVLVSAKIASFSKKVEDHFPKETTELAKLGMLPLSGEATDSNTGAPTNPSRPSIETAPSAVDIYSGSYQIIQPGTNIQYLPDAAGNESPIQEFALEGFSKGDAYVFSRDFVYYKRDGLEESGKKDYLVYDSGNLFQLEKYSNGRLNKEFKRSPLVTEPPFALTTREDFIRSDGYYWIKRLDEGGDPVETKKGEEYQEGATYRVYFIIVDDGPYDLKNDSLVEDGDKVIQDPNGLYLQPASNYNTDGTTTTRACSVGNGEMYDILLLFLATLAFVTFRTYRRKVKN